jgi:2,3-bisphosphoglycerate-dependent phosphoglycerate mutase
VTTGSFSQETSAGFDRVANGVDPPLAAEGVAQAHACGQWLQALLAGMSQVYCSPARRAVDTALALGIGRPRRARALADRDWGSWFVGFASDQLVDRLDEARQAASRDPWDWRPPGGESLRDLRQRVGIFLIRLLSEWRDKKRTLVVVSHGEPLLATRALVEGNVRRHPLRQLPSGPLHALPNAGVLIYSRIGPNGDVDTEYRWRCLQYDFSASHPERPPLEWVNIKD